MPDRDDRLPGEPEPRFSEGQEQDVETAEKERIGNFASREASSEEIGPLGEPPAHEHAVRDRDDPAGAGTSERPGSIAGDALDDDVPRVEGDRPGRLRGDLTAGLTDVIVGPGDDEIGRRGIDDQEDRPEQERHRRFSEGQESEGETSEKERQGDFATGQREDDDDR